MLFRSPALDAIDIAVEPGEFVAFLGPSGCGKSTLLYLVAGLEPVTSGEIVTSGERVTGPSPDRSLIFQETSLFPWLAVWQNVAGGLGIRGKNARARKPAARQARQRVGWTAAFDKPPEEFS